MGPLNLLLDTHIWLWSKFEPDRLPSPVRRRIRQNPDLLVLSAVCVLEVSLKHARGRLKMEGEPSNLFQGLVDDGVSDLAITRDHTLRSALLPRHHQDPFDRLLVAQALIEGLTVVTADPHVLEYDVPTIDARK